MSRRTWPYRLCRKSQEQSQLLTWTQQLEQRWLLQDQINDISKYLASTRSSIPNENANLGSTY